MLQKENQSLLKKLKHKLHKPSPEQLQIKELNKLNKEIKKNKKAYYKIKQNYINFLKNNNQWDDELEKKFNPKKIKDIFIMDKFDEAFAIRYARSKVFSAKNKFSLKKKKAKFGDEKEETFIFYYELMKVVEHICRVNNWTKREDWIKHGVNMNEMFKKYFIASEQYADIRKYYTKKNFDERQSKYIGK